MSIPYTVTTCLHNHDVDFDVISHSLTSSSQRTAEASHISGELLAKAVVLADGENFVMAVIPATHRLESSSVSNLLHKSVEMVSELDFSMVFRDCQVGAIPPMGFAYGMKTIVDDSLRERSELYLECGDHQHLLHVTKDGFLKLTEGCAHATISSHI